MTELKAELDEAVEQLNEHYGELVDAARDRLGTLFNAGDYPDSLIGMFDIQWDFPSVEPPNYLRQLNPQLYEQEAQRVAARFDEAVQLAEQAFMEELAALVSHLTERLAGNYDGKPKTFRDTSVTNLTDFFERFRRLNVRSDEQLDELVQRAQQVVRGCSHKSCATVNHSASTSTRSSLACSRRWTGCWSTVPAATSSVAPSEALSCNLSLKATARYGACTTRRWTWRHWANWRYTEARMSSPTITAAGSQISHRLMVRCWGHSPNVVTHSTRKPAG